MVIPVSHVDASAPELERPLVRSAKPLVLGQLGRSVVHELGNPLCAALGLIELLLAEDDLPGRHRELVALLEESCLRIQAVVSALGAVARDDLEQMGSVSLPGLVEETVALLTRTTAAPDVEIVQRVRVDAEVEARPAAVKQVLLNLLLNAQQAMPVGGTATVELARDGEWVELSVADTGPGIDADVFDRIFEPFFTTHTEREHAGLGLPVSLALARLLGGDLRATSERGEGARFTLLLPASGGPLP